MKSLPGYLIRKGNYWDSMRSAADYAGWYSALWRFSLSRHILREAIDMAFVQ